MAERNRQHSVKMSQLIRFYYAFQRHTAALVLFKIYLSTSIPVNLVKLGLICKNPITDSNAGKARTDTIRTQFGRVCRAKAPTADFKGS